MKKMYTSGPGLELFDIQAGCYPERFLFWKNILKIKK